MLWAVAFWQEHRATYSCLADTALDFVGARASQAYVERVFFSVCGMLAQGRHNRMSMSLEMRLRLKLNVKLIGWLGWQTFYPLYCKFDFYFFIYMSTAFLTCLVWTTWLISLQLNLFNHFCLGKKLILKWLKYWN